METRNNDLTKKRKIGYVLLALLMAFGLILFLLPASYFDTGTPMCLSVILFNRNCYGCGMTRGVMHLIHFDFVEAWEFNKLSFIVFPLLVYMILWEIYTRFLKK
ncbi:MAG: DUF2752 domain-containing protein [Bacteroidia bacterium]|nr:DUF2752 domain-containing protein [Bacteroidia bacterium]MCF8425796.1 DUF2752 domain-containing protein [Bacteroidia bacterium]